MRARHIVLLSAILVGAASVSAWAQGLSEVYKKVNPSVVVIFTQQKEIASASGAGTATFATLVAIGLSVLFMGLTARSMAARG